MSIAPTALRRQPAGRKRGDVELGDCTRSQLSGAHLLPSDSRGSCGDLLKQDGVLKHCAKFDFKRGTRCCRFVSHILFRGSSRPKEEVCEKDGVIWSKLSVLFLLKGP